MRKFLLAMPNNLTNSISQNVNHSGGTHPSYCFSMQVDASFVSTLISSGMGGDHGLSGELDLGISEEMLCK